MEEGTRLPKNGIEPALNHIDKIYEEYTIKSQQNEQPKPQQHYVDILWEEFYVIRHVLLPGLTCLHRLILPVRR